MFLSYSNIAWTRNIDDKVYQILMENSFDAIDIAPGSIFTDPINISADEKAKFRNKLNEFKLSTAGVQSLLFGKNDLKIFDNQESRLKTLSYLKELVNSMADLGFKTLIFGSPVNRQVGNLDSVSIESIAIDFFAELGKFSEECGICFCLEPNPRIYNCDFLYTTEQALKFVKKIDCSGLKMNLDLGTIKVNNESLTDIINVENLRYFGHVHISESELKPIAEDLILDEFLNLLNEINYSGYTAIEMRKATEDAQDNINIIENIARSISLKAKKSRAS